MRPPRRWVVWMVVVVVGGIALGPSKSAACPRPALILPRESSGEVSGDPDVPVNPGPSVSFRPPRLLVSVVRLGRAEWVTVVMVEWFLPSSEKNGKTHPFSLRNP
jgi:hypothetical protein